MKENKQGANKFLNEMGKHIKRMDIWASRSGCRKLVNIEVIDLKSDCEEKDGKVVKSESINAGDSEDGNIHNSIEIENCAKRKGMSILKLGRITNAKYPLKNEYAGHVTVTFEEEMEKMEVGKVYDGNSYNDDTSERKIYRSNCEWGNIGKIISFLRMNGIKITKKET